MYKEFKQLVGPLWVCVICPADNACTLLLASNSYVHSKHINMVILTCGEIF
jgi:hypothetical protein